jgi:hypothetical protein
MGETAIGAGAIGATAVVSAGWFGAACGRLLSMSSDNGTQTKFNRLSTAVEIAMFVLVGAPWLMWLVGVGN